MAVEARFYIAEVKRQAYGGASHPVGSVRLMAVTRGEADRKWAQATPAGSIEMTLNSTALEWFDARLGKDVRVLLDDAPEADA